jgi:hypothetical protein
MLAFRLGRRRKPTPSIGLKSTSAQSHEELGANIWAMLSHAPIQWTDPATWPWMFYVWAVFALVVLAKPAWIWFRRQRAGGWPSAEGRIESVEITKPSFSFTTKRGYYVAELGFSYSVAGTLHSGLYKSEFPTEHEAEEFVRDLKGKPVAVPYNAIPPSRSALLEPDIESLQQNGAPSPLADYPSAANSVPDWIRRFLVVFRFPFCDWSRRQSVDSSRSGHGTPRGTGSILLGVGCRNLHRVAPSRLSGAAARR